MDHIRNEVDIRVASAATTALAEAQVLGELVQQHLEVVHGERVGGLAHASGLQQVVVVSGERAGEERLGDVGPPDGQDAVALCVGVLQRRVLPLVAAGARRADGVRVAVDVDEIEVGDRGVAAGLARLCLEAVLQVDLGHKMKSGHE